ncbi:hypothetical protein [Cellulomonas denverensis]|uniref:Uncharacterized protein n=1 Tax=Cellulomonas denverensis TaxID=264297 RepID=A0A7X6KY56_9CELL|nr:hypothetical protein [Cellulomonas denverensis]NKY24344.1 hypothetical protein [Cellulomonas denverensis]
MSDPARWVLCTAAGTVIGVALGWFTPLPKGVSIALGAGLVAVAYPYLSARSRRAQAARATRLKAAPVVAAGVDLDAKAGGGEHLVL